MRHGKDGYKLGRKSAHRMALFRNLLTALFRHERITTTEAKAKAVRGLADRLVTLAKRESLHARRQALALVPDPEVVRSLFDTVAARFADRAGGYTRIIKAGFRRGDNAPLAILELVERGGGGGDAKEDKKAERKARARRGRAGATGGRGGRKRKAAASSA